MIPAKGREQQRQDKKKGKSQVIIMIIPYDVQYRVKQE
jgi:hypothetical protein